MPQTGGLGGPSPHRVTVRGWDAADGWWLLRSIRPLCDRGTSWPLELAFHPLFMGAAEMVGEPFDLTTGQRRQLAMDDEDVAIALGRSKATGALNRPPERAMSTTFGSESELASPFGAGEVETIGVLVKGIDDATEQKQT